MVEKVLVIGAGVIGVSCAYALRRYGFDVTVLERLSGPGQGTSFANGALLTPSMPEPWNAPGCWRMLLRSFGRSDGALRVHVKAIPSLVRWGFGFLRNSDASLYESHTLSNLRLALFSLATLQEWREQADLVYDGKTYGSLKLFRRQEDLDQAHQAAQLLRAHSLKATRLSIADTVKLEPELAPIASQLAGSIYYPDDEVGDAHRYCKAVAVQSQQLGVTYRYGCSVRGFDKRANRVACVKTDAGDFSADWIVIAGGCYSVSLLHALGIYLPVRPVKGYSITYPANASLGLRIPVVDHDAHAAVVPIGGSIRVVGSAEFAGYDRVLASDRLKYLEDLLMALFPALKLNPSEANPWCGLRPVCQDGMPVIGSTSIENLLVNTGHGHLGWTMAAGSAQLLANLLTGAKSPIDPEVYRATRFR